MIEALCLLSALPLGVALINGATWHRPVVPRSGSEPVSVLIPARNEASSIRRAVQSALAARDPSGEPIAAEVLVYDDDSSDDTAAQVRELAREDARVRLIAGGSLPSGWVGKPYGCQRLYEEAAGETLVFMDADVELEELGLARLLSSLERGVDLVSAVPRQVTLGFAERAIVSLLLLTYVAWLPLRWVETQRSPSFVAANGQLLAARRRVFADLDGFRRVRQAIVDDVALARLAKEHEKRVRFADGTALASCRMYASSSEVWGGFSKNIAAGLGGSFPSVLAVVSLYLACFVLPYVVLGVGLASSDDRAIAFGGVGVIFNVSLRLGLCLRYRQAPEQILLHPLSVLLLTIIAWNSWLWVRSRRISWAGRTYVETRG